jgi:hypothetical protein
VKEATFAVPIGGMDCRVKPGNDEVKSETLCH